MSVYCARHFSTEDIQTIQALIANSPGLKRTALSRRICQVLNWTKPNGELKDMSCRVALLRMQADGLLDLPPSRSPPPQRPPPGSFPRPPPMPRLRFKRPCTPCPP